MTGMRAWLDWHSVVGLGTVSLQRAPFARVVHGDPEILHTTQVNFLCAPIFLNAYPRSLLVACKDILLPGQAKSAADT